MATKVTVKLDQEWVASFDFASAREGTDWRRMFSRHVDSRIHAQDRGRVSVEIDYHAVDGSEAFVPEPETAFRNIRWPPGFRPKHSLSQI